MTIDNIVIAVALALGFFVMGFVLGEHTKQPLSAAEIEVWLRKQFPNEWTAYKSGVNEGYAQGLRDCQEDPT